MIKIYEQNDEITLDDFMKILYYYLDVNGIDEDISIDYYDNDCDEVNISIWKAATKIHKITDNQKCRMLISIILDIIIEISDDENLMDFKEYLSEVDIEYNGIRNNILKYTDIQLVVARKTIDEDSTVIPYDYYAGIANTIMYELDLDKQWIIIFRYDKDDEILYPYADHLEELQKLLVDNKLEDYKIILDHYIGYSIIKNDISDDEMAFLKLSLGTSYKILTSKTYEKLFEEIME